MKSSQVRAAPPESVDGEAPSIPSEPTRFERKRELILDAATTLINQRGVKGMTFVEVAQQVKLNTASVTYYFRLKEQLAAAVFENTLGRLEAMVREAGAEATPRERVARYLELHFNLRARIRRGEERPIAVLSDMRALDEAVRGPLVQHYGAIFRELRAFFGPTSDEAHKALQTARAQVLSENVFWLPVWLGRYSISDYDRVRRRLMELFEHGMAPDDAVWDPGVLDLGEGAEAQDAGRLNFLRAATRLISERGYRGASVERIALELKVTKGSFYHHMDAKDDLVLECFERSYERVSQAQRAADAAGGSQWRRLSSAIAALLDIQFAGEWPLLRTTALQTLPSEVRPDVVERSNRMALRFAGTLVDGISEGSIRAIDPMIASQAIMSTLNAAYELHGWPASWLRQRVVEVYASALAHGLFDDRAI
ncbi:MAG: TetR family transcriptional regulator [Caulobacteraceae bacterium]